MTSKALVYLGSENNGAKQIVRLLRMFFFSFFFFGGGGGTFIVC